MPSELELLQAVRLKGRPRQSDLASTLDAETTVVESALTALTSRGLLSAGSTIRLTSAGRERLADLLETERRGIDADAVMHGYQRFRAVNRDFKELVAQWQMRDGAPNDHSDEGYDRALLDRLTGLHRTLEPILESIERQVPRLADYAAKLSTALTRIDDGDVTWFARPIIDSYHTVWFELHEELLGVLGLSREDEARAGHAE